MTDYEFSTPEPVRLYVELGRGAVRVTADDVETSRVTVDGERPEEVQVEFDGHELRVIGPRERGGFLRSQPSFGVAIEVPSGTELAVRTASADVTVAGPVGATQVRTGSGQVGLDIVDGPGDVESGSGDVTIGTAAGELRIKSGSGDVELDQVEGAVAISVGSGDIRIGGARGPVAAKAGSGDLLVTDVHDDVSFTSGSGDLQIGTAHAGTITSKGASGDVLIGVAPGVPVWTDISTLTGDLHSDLVGAGEPAEGVPHVALRVTTVSGDVVLRQR